MLKFIFIQSLFAFHWSIYPRWNIIYFSILSMTRSNMKKDNRSQSSDNRTNKNKKLQKGKKKKKYLTYTVKKGEEQKQWKVARILRDRITLVPKIKGKQQSPKQKDFQNQREKIGFDKLKEFEIQWQPSENGAWANTWQPQENISDFTKLHYLLQKIDELKSRNLNKQLSEFYKKRETFQNHKKFTNSKYTVKPTQELSQQQKILSIKKILSKQKISPAVKKVPSYKDWYISYSMYEQEFEKIVYRFLRNEPANTSIIYSAKTKIQFLQQIIPSEQQNVITKHLKSQQNLKTKAQSAEASISLSYMPRQACLRFILNVDYHGNLKNVDYFKLQLFDGQYMYTSEQDLVKYYPFAYQKFLTKKINETTEQAMESLTRIQDKEEFNLSFNQKHISKLSEKIGINDAYSIPFCQEFSTSVLFGNAQAESPPKDKNSLCQVNKYFDCINLSSDQAPIVIAFDDQEIPFNYPERNFSDLAKFTQCSVLFKKGNKQKTIKTKEDFSKNMKQLKRSDQKIQSSSGKKEQLKPKLKQKSIELEVNIQVEERIKQATKTNSKNKKTKQELSSIQDDSRKEKNKKSVPVQNISCQQKQVNHILDLMDGRNFFLKDNEVYDSDDSQRSK